MLFSAMALVYIWTNEASMNDKMCMVTHQDWEVLTFWDWVKWVKCVNSILTSSLHWRKRNRLLTGEMEHFNHFKISIFILFSHNLLIYFLTLCNIIIITPHQWIFGVIMGSIFIFYGRLWLFETCLKCESTLVMFRIWLFDFSFYFTHKHLQQYTIGK